MTDLACEDNTLECDLLVIGAGMAGMSAAGFAAQAGARVIVVERGPQIGGSAVLSGGYLWTATSPERLRLYGGGRPDLGEVVLRNYVVGLDWLRRRGVTVGRAVSVLHGRGYQIDIADHIRGCADLVAQHDGHVVLDTIVERLLTNDHGAVIGARTTHMDGAIDVLASRTILATGGFQNSSELRAAFIHPNAHDGLLMRTNPQSRGDGMRLAIAVGGDVTRSKAGFYGHLVSESPRWGEPGLFTLLTQYHSEQSLLFNEDGLRFCDESLGDHVSANSLVAQTSARAACFWDSRIHEEFGTTAVVKGSETVDKMKIALDHGGRGVIADSLEEVGNFASAHGFDGVQLCKSIREYNHRCSNSWEVLNPSRAENFGALDRAPYFVLIVVPAITQTHDGLRVDAQTRVLQCSGGTPVQGLLAAGADVGDVYGSAGRYSGGLGMALALGLQAAMTAGFIPVSFEKSNPGA